MRKSTCIVFVLTAVLLFACKRDRHTYIFNGRAIDQYTQTPIANAKVHFSEYYKHGHEDILALGDATTDQNGNFSFQSDQLTKGFESLVIAVNTSDYYATGHVGISSLQSTNTVTIPCGTHSQIYYDFINTSPFDQNDQLSDIYIERPFGSQWVFPSSSQVLTGMAVDETVWTSFCGYTSNVLHYTVTKNSITQNYTDTLLTPNPMLWAAVNDTIRY